MCFDKNIFLRAGRERKSQQSRDDPFFQIRLKVTIESVNGLD